MSPAPFLRLRWQGRIPLAVLLRLKDGNAFTTSVAFAWFIVVLVL
jgi:hypothetical protein